MTSFLSFGAYSMAVLVVGVLLLKFDIGSHWLARIWLGPLVGEIALACCRMRLTSYWKGLLFRFGSLSAAEALLYNFYLVPVYYSGIPPAGEWRWAWILVASQTGVASVLSLFSWLMTRHRRFKKESK